MEYFLIFILPIAIFFWGTRLVFSINRRITAAEKTNVLLTEILVEMKKEKGNVI
jgi:hypothetical protein